MTIGCRRWDSSTRGRRYFRHSLLETYTRLLSTTALCDTGRVSDLDHRGYLPLRSIFTHVSRSPTVRLKIKRPDVESFESARRMRPGSPPCAVRTGYHRAAPRARQRRSSSI